MARLRFGGSVWGLIRQAGIAAMVLILALGSVKAQVAVNEPDILQKFWNYIPRLPLGDMLEHLIDLVTSSFGPQFAAVVSGINAIFQTFNKGLLALPALFVGVVISVIVWRLAGFLAGVYSVVALLLIGNLGLWPQTMSTFALMGTSVALALVIGIPLGIFTAHSNMLQSVLTPVLDFCQTMPPFVYLIPAVIMFGIGPVPGIIATVIYAAPVAIRLTNVGIRQVDPQVIEAGEAFGCGRVQLLFKIKLPLAFPVIAAGVNQTIIYALGMVIIASMIGAGGLGAEILRGITRLQFGVGFEAGLAVVLVAILLDRMGRGLSKTFGSEKSTREELQKRPNIIGRLKTG